MMRIRVSMTGPGRQRRGPVVQCKAAIVRTLAAAGMLFMMLPGASGAEQLVGVGTGGINGVYYPLGGALCRLVNAGRREHGLHCMVESTAGSVSNIDAVMAGSLDLGLAQSDAQYTALKGLGPYQERPQPKLRALFSVYPESFTLVARRDADIKGVGDLRGKRVYIGNPGSATRAIAEFVLHAHGIGAQALNLSAELEFAELATALCGDRIDAFAVIVGHPNANVRAAADACAVNIAAVSGPAIDQVIKDFPFLGKASVPGGIYKGMNLSQPSFGVFATVVASADLPEETAYQLTKSVFDRFEELRQSHPALAHITRASMLAGNTVPFHPGAVRYFMEQGMMK